MVKTLLKFKIDKSHVAKLKGFIGEYIGSLFYIKEILPSLLRKYDIVINICHFKYTGLPYVPKRIHRDCCRELAIVHEKFNYLTIEPKSGNKYCVSYTARPPIPTPHSTIISRYLFAEYVLHVNREDFPKCTKVIGEHDYNKLRNITTKLGIPYFDIVALLFNETEKEKPVILSYLPSSSYGEEIKAKLIELKEILMFEIKAGMHITFTDRERQLISKIKNAREGSSIGIVCYMLFIPIHDTLNLNVFNVHMVKIV